jgi:type VI secretion system secreted protein VgrG
MTDVLGFRVECAELAGLPSHVRSFQVEEQLNAPYRAAVALQVEGPDVDVAGLLGADVTLFIDRRPLARPFRGIVRHVVQEGHGITGFVARLYFGPALDLLDLRRDTRMWQEKTVPEILEAVLGEGLGAYQREVRNELRGTYPRREYTLQYQESDLSFVHRLMEEEGIGYAFDHEGEREVMVLRDENAAYPRVESLGPIHLSNTNFVAREREPVYRFALRHRTTTTSAVVRDWDWTKSGDMVVSAEARGKDERGRERESYEHGLDRSLRIHDYAGGRYSANDSAGQKGVRRDAHVVGGVTGAGVGQVIGFSAGAVFAILDNPAPGLDGEYLLTRVRHESTAPRVGIQGGEDYHNTFECVPIGTRYRPARRAPKPSIASVQTAIVTGPAGEEIHTDEHGRIKVQFHWDRENPADETSSCWIRVQQPWAGSGWGFWWVPRIGMEVVVHFVDGDPDRPLVTGCVYNGTNSLPYPMPDEKTKSTIKSNSSIGGGGFNELRFEDRAGGEEIYSHAQKDYNEVVENDHNTLVHNNQTNTVDVDQTQVVGANQTETVHGNQVMTVDANRTVVVHSNYSETVDGTETRLVTGNVNETFDANETRQIGASVTETIGANETVSVAGNYTETILGGRATSVVAAATTNIDGSRTTMVAGGVTQTTGGAYSLTATGGITIVAAGGVTLDAGGGMVNLAPGGITKVDSQWEWQGGYKHEFGGFKIFEVGGVKVGITWGASVELNGFKAEGTICNASITLAKNELKGGVVKAVGLKIKARALKSKALPTIG